MAFDLKRFITEEQFIQCKPVAADNFVSFCTNCDLQIGKHDLEMLEREGGFCPLIRVQFPKYIQKIRRLANDEYEILGPLEEGESWDGETQEAYGSFGFIKEAAEEYYRERLLWRPQDRPFEPWKNFSDEDGQRFVESYYSSFQIYHLWNLWKRTSISIPLIWWGSLDEDERQEKALELAEVGKQHRKVWAEGGDRFTQAVEVCIAIANRYYPNTQSDRRTIRFSMPLDYEWDWRKYCRRWNANEELSKLNISPENLRELQRDLASEAQHIDPIRDWYSLVQFVSLGKKEKLKDKALLAQKLYAMATMLRLFFQHVTGERLVPPDGVGPKHYYYGDGVSERELEFLEYLTNQYNLNPRPRLILVVEGKGELDQIPRIAQVIGYSLDRVGIRLEFLGGISEFTGDQMEGKSGGRLARFIDYHHQLQTLVYCILDNENGSRKVKDKLLKARSRYPQSRRFVTKEDYLFVWEKNFEFDNFTDSAIAKALSSLAGNQKSFSETEVNNCRQNFGKPGYQLEKLFRCKTKRELNKRELARILVDGFVEGTKRGESREPPKIVSKLQEIIRLARQNQPPVRKASWLRNQESGFLAPLISR